MISFQNLHQPTRRSLLFDDKSYLFFGGTAYLGLLDNPEYIALYKDGIDRYGLNNGTSRSNNIQLGIYHDVEENMAVRFGFEATALFSSGYLAAQAVVRTLLDGREVMYAPACHPALWIDGDPKVLGSFEEWAMQTMDYINSSENRDFVVISNCIDNLRPAKYDFTVFQHISEDKNVLLILDDSHGLAVVNKDAVSSDIHLLRQISNIDIVVVSSLAKGLGTDAGIVLGSVKVIDKLKKHPIFMGASPASPASMYALLYSDKIYARAFDKLHQNIDYFVGMLPIDHGLSFIDSFPVFSSFDPLFFDYLSQNNILISSFPYPLPTSQALNRIVISSLHTFHDLKYLSEIISSKDK